MGRIDFDPLADRYDEGRALPDWATDPWRDVIVEQAAARVTGLVVDVGCGTGSWLPLLSTWLTSDVVGIEISLGMSTRAHRAGAGAPPDGRRLSVLQGHAQRLPLRAGCADVAWVSNVLHHLDDVAMAARELRRVLRAEGAVLVRTYAHGLFTEEEYARAVSEAGLAGRYLTGGMIFPGVRQVLATYPTIDELDTAFGAAGLHRTFTDAVVHGIADSSTQLLQRLETRADTTLQLLDDGEFATGLGQLRADIERDPELAARPVIAPLPFLVYRLASDRS